MLYFESCKLRMLAYDSTNTLDFMNISYRGHIFKLQLQFFVYLFKNKYKNSLIVVTFAGINNYNKLT